MKKLEQIVNRNKERKGIAKSILPYVLSAVLSMSSVLGLDACKKQEKSNSSSTTQPVGQLEQRVQVGTPLQFENFGMRWEHESNKVEVPVVNENYVYFSSGGSISALDSRTGKETWNFKIIKDLNTPPIIQDGMLFFVNIHIHAVEPNTGKLVWITPKESLFEPTILKLSNKVLYSLGFMNNYDTESIYGFSSKDGKEVFRMDFKKLTGASSPIHLTLDQNSIIAITHFGSYSIDLKTKKLNWQQTGVFYDDRAGAELFDNMLYYLVDRSTRLGGAPGGGSWFTKIDEELLAIDMSTGKIKWKFDKHRDYPNGFKFPSPIFFSADQQPIIVNMGSGKQYTINAKTGKEMTMPSVPLDVVVYDGMPYALDKGRISAYNPVTKKVMREYKSDSINGILFGVDKNGFYLRDDKTIRAFGNVN